MYKPYKPYAIDYFDDHPEDFEYCNHVTSDIKGYFFKNNLKYILYVNGNGPVSNRNRIIIRDLERKTYPCIGIYLATISEDDKKIFIDKHYEATEGLFGTQWL